jgi:hypothetical protein
MEREQARVQRRRIRQMMIHDEPEAPANGHGEHGVNAVKTGT